MIAAIMEYQFLQNALAAGVLASIVCGLIGVVIIEKKLVMMSGGIAHASFGGIGLGYYLGFEPIWGALLVSSCASLGIGFFKRHSGTNADALIGLFWSIGMALGILFIALSPGYPPDMSSYLFGNILSVRRVQLLLMAGLSLVILLAILLLFNYWKAYLFDEQFALVRGINVVFLEYLLYFLVAIAVVVLIRVVGIVLILALLTAPPVIAARLTTGLKARMICSVLLGVFFCSTGLWLSYELNLASGASIVLLAGITYILVSITLPSLRKKQVKKF